MNHQARKHYTLYVLMMKKSQSLAHPNRLNREYLLISSHWGGKDMFQCLLSGDPLHIPIFSFIKSCNPCTIFLKRGSSPYRNRAKCSWHNAHNSSLSCTRSYYFVLLVRSLMSCSSSASHNITNNHTNSKEECEDDFTEVLMEDLVAEELWTRP